MTIKEENMSDEAKAILAIIREEALIGRLTQKQKELLDKAVVLHEAVGIFGKFIVWFAGLLAAITAIWTYIPKR